MTPFTATTSPVANPTGVSEKVNVRVVEAPAVKDAGAAVIATVGAKVSMACVLSVLAALTLPAASVTALAARARETEPLATPAVGVTFTTQAVPLPVMVLMVPLVTVKSLEVRPVTDSLKV